MKVTEFEMAAVREAAYLMLTTPQAHHTIEQLAGKVNLSRSKFIEAFKAVHGQNPGQYLLKQRIEKAMKLLKDSDLPLKKIAATVGYDDVSAFVRAFKRETSVSPIQYRNEHQVNG